MLCTALSAYAELQRLAGSPRDALPARLEGLALAEQLPGGEHLAPQLLAELLHTHAALGHVASAVAYGDRALDAARHIGDLMNEVALLPDFGDALLAAGHSDRARKAYQRFLDLSADQGLADSLAHESGRSTADLVDHVRARLAVS